MEKTFRGQPGPFFGLCGDDQPGLLLLRPPPASSSTRRVRKWEGNRLRQREAPPPFCTVSCAVQNSVRHKDLTNQNSLTADKIPYRWRTASEWGAVGPIKPEPLGVRHRPWHFLNAVGFAVQPSSGSSVLSSKCQGGSPRARRFSWEENTKCNTWAWAASHLAIRFSNQVSACLTQYKQKAGFFATLIICSKTVIHSSNENKCPASNRHSRLNRVLISGDGWDFVITLHKI